MLLRCWVHCSYRAPTRSHHSCAPLTQPKAFALALLFQEASWHLKAQLSVFDGVTYTRWWLLSIWQPWNNERSVPVLGSCSASNIFLLCFQRSHESSSAWRRLTKATAGEDEDLQAIVQAFTGEQKPLPLGIPSGTAIRTHSHQHSLPAQSREGPLPPLTSFPSPFLLHFFPVGFPLWLNFWYVGTLNNKTDNSREMDDIYKTYCISFILPKTLRDNPELRFSFLLKIERKKKIIRAVDKFSNHQCFIWLVY